MTKIPVHLLNAFVVFNESRNIMEAAQHLGITQPALSKQLQALEKNLPHSIFTLSGRRKVLTPFGKDLHRELKSRLGNIQEAIQQVAIFYTSSSNAAVKIAGRRGVLDRISGRLTFPGALSFVEAAHEEIIDSLLKRKIEVGITHKVPDTHELIAKVLFKEEFQLVIPKTLLPDRPVLSAELLARLLGLPCLGYKEPDEILQALCGVYSLDAKQLRMIRVTSNYSSLAEMTSSALGWAALPIYLPVPSGKNWLIPLPPKVFPARTFFISFRREFGGLPWFKELVQDISRCFKV